jgi:hypothetical protein
MGQAAEGCARRGEHKSDTASVTTARMQHHNTGPMRAGWETGATRGSIATAARLQPVRTR